MKTCESCEGHGFVWVGQKPSNPSEPGLVTDCPNKNCTDGKVLESEEEKKLYGILT